MLRRSSLFLAVTSVAVLVAGVASAQYYVTDLGVLPGGTASWAMAVNDSGVVAGSSRTSTGAASARATIFTGGAWLNIGSAISASRGTFATGINDNGQVSLWLRGGSPDDTYIYQSGTYTNIGAQPGVCNGLPNQSGYDPYQIGNYTFAGAINSSGQLAGEYSRTDGNLGGYIWNGSSTTAVTTPATGTGSDFVSSINNAGVVVGTYQVGIDPVGVGFYFDATGTEHDISGGTYPEFIAGNNVVGNNYYTDDAFVYTLGAAAAADIGHLNGDEGSVAYGVNSSGTIVGSSWNTSAYRAFIYSGGTAGTMTDLNTLISGPNPFSNLEYAVGISNNGKYIVGNGIVAANGEEQGFLLTAAIPGDANGDGKVDINDLTIVLAHYNQTGQTWSTGAFTADGKVDINDLTIVLAHYNDSVGAGAGNLSAVPEPGALLLAAAALIGLLGYARRKRT